MSGPPPRGALAQAPRPPSLLVGRSFEAEGSVRYSLLVPPSRLRAGLNRMRIYRVLDSARRLQLQLLGETGP